MLNIFRIYLNLLLFIATSSAALTMERRKPQFLTEPVHLILPMPYSLPGIGEGIMFTGLAANILETHFDLYGLAITSDAEGILFGAKDFYLKEDDLRQILYWAGDMKAAEWHLLS